jgi:hypothetical protein
MNHHAVFQKEEGFLYKMGKLVSSPSTKEGNSGDSYDCKESTLLSSMGSRHLDCEEEVAVAQSIQVASPHFHHYRSARLTHLSTLAYKSDNPNLKHYLQLQSF